MFYKTTFADSYNCPDDMEYRIRDEVLPNSKMCLEDIHTQCPHSLTDTLLDKTHSLTNLPY